MGKNEKTVDVVKFIFVASLHVQSSISWVIKKLLAIVNSYLKASTHVQSSIGSFLSLRYNKHKIMHLPIE